MNPHREIRAWGDTRRALARLVTPAWLKDLEIPETPVLARGLGGSAGDVALLDGGLVIDTHFLDHLIDFDPATGLLAAEAGIPLEALLRFCVPHGWFLPVVPANLRVTLGGAIANDIHGTNHHRAGTFGRHVPSFELLRSDGSRRVIGRDDPLHAATIGGLGLTGMITRAEIQLVRVPSAWLDVELVKFRNLDEWRDLADASGDHWEYSSAWVDCHASGVSRGRGVLVRGNWSFHGGLRAEAPPRARPRLPKAFLGAFLTRILNSWSSQHFLGRHDHRHQHYPAFFARSETPGRAGFHQYQCVIPRETAVFLLKEILERLERTAEGSWLGELKTFGELPSPGLLSFPKPGITLALEFAHRGIATDLALADLDKIVHASGGRLYPAKDTRMRIDDFVSSYPALAEFKKHLDPGFLSEFWKRMNP